ncbi:MAG: hypothetical protein M3552_02475 [Planctomycetota bacterium]|nr:hypothetical protein [Planctomycetaceae bacterium]MDQ3329512.1 hypothetical protein [Planctomycetota bacterium]
MRPSKILLGLTIGAATLPAAAQPPGFGRPRNPPLSPYLNLLNDNNSTGFNYYQLYRPQTEFRSAYQGLNQNLYQAESQIARQGESIEQIGSRVRPGSSLRTTGHTTSFMNYGRYFGTGNAASPVR